MAKEQKQQQSHPIADQFSDEEMEAIKRYGQALGGSTDFSDEVEKHLAGHEAYYKKMRAAATGGSLDLGPTEAEQKQVQQQEALQRNQAVQSQAQAAQAQAGQTPVNAPAAPAGPTGTQTPYPAQARQESPGEAIAATQQPPPAPGEASKAPGFQSGGLIRGAHGKLPRGEHDKSQPVYLRIGDWDPKRERSQNYARGMWEPGLSVYHLDEKHEPIAPSESEWAEQDLNDRLRSEEPKHLVQGQHVGVGHDGEPLLQNVRVVGKWKGKSGSAPGPIPPEAAANP